MVGRKAKDIVLGLATRVAHQHVPLALGRGGREGFVRLEQRALALVALVGARLLGFQNEAAALVEIDPQGRGQTFGFPPFHATLEHIVIGPSVVAGRVRPGKTQRPAQLCKEHLIVGALGAAARLAPPLDERIDVQIRLPRTRRALRPDRRPVAR